MKKVSAILFLSVLLIPSVTQAHWQGNWLLGVTGGYIARAANFELTMGHPAPGREVSIVIKDLDDGGTIGGFIGGYQAKCYRWIIGLELNASWDDLGELDNFAFADVLDIGWASSVRYQRELIAGLSMRLAYIETPFFIPYIRFGANTSEDSLLYAGITNPELPTLNSVVVVGSRRQYWLLGGIGFELPMPYVMRLSFRMEYNYQAPSKGVDAIGFTNENLTFVRGNGRGRHGTAIASCVWNFF